MTRSYSRITDKNSCSKFSIVFNLDSLFYYVSRIINSKITVSPPRGSFKEIFFRRGLCGLSGFYGLRFAVYVDKRNPHNPLNPRLKNEWHTSSRTPSPGIKTKFLNEGSLQETFSFHAQAFHAVAHSRPTGLRLFFLRRNSVRRDETASFRRQKHADASPRFPSE